MDYTVGDKDTRPEDAEAVSYNPAADFNLEVPSAHRWVVERGGCSLRLTGGGVAYGVAYGQRTFPACCWGVVHDVGKYVAAGCNTWSRQSHV